jgi:DNA invertase Pin-like site-specific DNA recombinase
LSSGYAYVMSDALLSRTDLLETQCEPIDMVCNNVVAMPLIQTETIATYQRVSSDVQSTKMQEAWLRQTLTNKGLNYDLAQHFIDEDTSATKKKDIDTRPEGKKLLALIQKGAISRLFVYRLDRLFRDTEYASKFLKVLEKKKVQLFSNDFAGDLTSADGQFIYGLQMLMAARETAVLGERVQHTMDKNTEALIPNSKCPPYGWDFVGVGNPKFNHGKGMVDVNWDEQMVIEWAQAQTISAKKIADILNDRNLTTKKGKQFSHSTVRRFGDNKCQTQIGRFKRPNRPIQYPFRKLQNKQPDY